MHIRLIIAALALARTAPLAAQLPMAQGARGDTLDLRRAVASARADPLTMNQITLTQTLPVNGTLGLRRAVARADSTRVDFLRVAAVLDVERGVRAAYWRVYHND